MPALARRFGFFTFGLLALSVISCSDAAEMDVSAFAQLELDASYPEPFSYLSGVREMSDGRILAADPLGQVLLSIDLESGVADTIGGVGGGPEEYEQPDRVFALPGDSTLLVDLGNARLTVIDPDMAFVETVTMAQQTESGSMLLLIPRFVDARGRIYFQGQSMGMGMGTSMPDSAYIARYDRGTGAVDTMGMVKLPEMERETTSGGMVSIGPRPMTPQDEWAVGADGTAVVVRGNDYSVDHYRPDGTFVDGPPNTVERLSVGQAEKEEWVNGMGADGIAVSMMRTTSGGTSMSLSRGGMGMRGGDEPGVNDYEFPDVLPIFRQSRMRVAPNGNSWVERWMEADSPPTFEIFDPQGVRIGTVQLPKGRRLIGFGDGTIYVVRIDEVDLRWLERYRLVRSAQ